MIEKSILGTFSASDSFISGTRYLYDNGRGGIYSGSASGTLVGNIFYAEGLVVLKSPNLKDFAFSSSLSGNYKWNISFKGTNTIPVKIFRCRAPAGELNCSSNPTFSVVDTSISASNRNQLSEIVQDGSTYITKIGLYNKNYELVGVASLGHPIRKNTDSDILFKLGLDW
jgi:hypothetical protein